MRNTGFLNVDGTDLVESTKLDLAAKQIQLQELNSAIANVTSQLNDLQSAIGATANIQRQGLTASLSVLNRQLDILKNEISAAEAYLITQRPNKRVGETVSESIPSQIPGHGGLNGQTTTATTAATPFLKSTAGIVTISVVSLALIGISIKILLR